MATFNINSNFSERIFVNITNQDAANFNLYQVPVGFFAILSRLQFEGRGFNSVNAPSVDFVLTADSFMDTLYYRQNIVLEVAPDASTVGNNSNLLFNGNIAKQIRSYVDGSGFRRLSGENTLSIRFEERNRIGHIAPAIFMNFNARLTIELFRYL